jgi:hypothetical protein
MEQPQNNQPVSPVQNQQPQQQNKTLGIVSLVTGIVGFFFLGIPLGITALVTGIIEKPKSGMAVAGIVLGVIDIVGAIYVLSLV